MKYSNSLIVDIFRFSTVFHLFVPCGETLFATPNTVTNATSEEVVLFPIQYNGTDPYDVTFRLKFPVPFKILTWKSNHPEKLHIVHPLYQHRVGIYEGFVMLNDVHVNDTGEYEIHIDYYGTELKNRDQITFKMHVFEPVSQPETAILGNCASSPNITLNCSVSKGTNFKIHWEKVPISGVLKETYDKTVLVIDCVTEEEKSVYRCIAENPISNATSDLVKVDLSNRTNPTGKRKYFMVLIPVVMTVLTLTIVCLYQRCYSLSGPHFLEAWTAPLSMTFQSTSEHGDVGASEGTPSHPSLVPSPTQIQSPQWEHI